MNIWIAATFALAVLFVATGESYAQQANEFVIPLDSSPEPGIIIGQSDAPPRTGVNINLDALSQPAMNLTVFGDTIEITHEHTFFTKQIKGDLTATS